MNTQMAFDDDTKDTILRNVAGLFPNVSDLSFFRQVFDSENWDLEKSVDIIKSLLEGEEVAPNDDRANVSREAHVDVRDRSSNVFYPNGLPPSSFSAISKMQPPSGTGTVPKPLHNKNQNKIHSKVDRRDQLLKTYKIIKQKQNPTHRISGYVLENIKLMIIMRGCPGSGKTYLANQIANTLAVELCKAEGKSTKDVQVSHHILSADDFWIEPKNGKYMFSADFLEYAHLWNQKLVRQVLSEGRSPIFIDNTHTRLWEMQAMATMAVEFGYVIEIVDPPFSNKWAFNENELVRRNTHGVHKEAIRRMIARYEHGLTPQKLLTTYKLSYPPNMSPPQRCIVSFNTPPSKNQLKLFNSRMYCVPLDVILQLKQDTSAGYSNGVAQNVSSSQFPTNCGRTFDHSINHKNFYDDRSKHFPKREAWFGSNGENGQSFFQSAPPQFTQNMFERISYLTGTEGCEGNFPSLNQKDDPSSSVDYLSPNNFCEKDVLQENAAAHESTSGSQPQMIFDTHLEKKNGTSQQQIVADLSLMKSDILREEPAKEQKVNNVGSVSSTQEIFSDESAPSSSISSLVNLSAPTEDEYKEPNAKECDTVNYQLYHDKLFPLNLKKSLRSSHVTQKVETWIDNLISADSVNGVPIESTSSLNDPCDPSKISIWQPPEYFEKMSNFAENSDEHWNPNASSSTRQVNRAVVDSWNKPVFLPPELNHPSQTGSPKSQRCQYIRKVNNTVDNSSNTNYQDFDTLYKINDGIDVCEHKILTGNSFAFECAAGPSEFLKIKAVATHDKSSLTLAESLTVKADSGVEILQKMFPNVPLDCLEELFERCHGDLDWTVNLIMDSGHEISEGFVADKLPTESIAQTTDNDVVETPTNMETTEPQPVAPKPKKSKNKLVDEYSDLVKEFEGNFILNEDCYSDHLKKVRDFRMGKPTEKPREEPVSRESTPIDDSDVLSNDVWSDDEGDMSLVMPGNFITQLQNKFGPIPNLYGEELVVKLPVSLGRQIYSYVLESLCVHVEEQQAVFGLLSKEDDTFAEQFPELPPGIASFQDIVDQELALKRQKKATSSSEATFASTLSHQLLTERFPNIDSSTLKNILEDTNLSLNEATNLLTLAGHEPVLPSASDTSKTHVQEESYEVTRAESIGQANTYHEVAVKLDEMRRVYMKKATEKYNSGNHAVAMFYNEMVKWYSERIKETNTMAAEVMIHGNERSTTVDLHFLNVSESIRVMDLFIDNCIRQLKSRKMEIFLITGRGLHSTHGKAKIKPAVKQRLKQRGLKFIELNPGMLKTVITKTSLESFKIK